MAGPDGTPDPTTCAQLYRLLSVYSLVKPPKEINTNVRGADNIKALMSAHDPVGDATDERLKEFDDILDQVLANGMYFAFALQHNQHQNMSHTIVLTCMTFYRESR